VAADVARRMCFPSSFPSSIARARLHETASVAYTLPLAAPHRGAVRSAAFAAAASRAAQEDKGTESVAIFEVVTRAARASY